jgi:carbonic anhydrase
VTAAAEAGEPAGHLPSLVAKIRPAVERARRQPGDLIENAVRLNVENVVSQIRASKPLLADVIARGELKVVGAVYSLDSGKVAWLPDQSSAAPPSAGDACPR